MKSYEVIKEFYGTRKTKRSKTPLINHINEGLKILDRLQSSEIVKEAYCLHPLLQSDEDFNKNKSYDFKGVPSEAIILAMEYRRVANSYLSTNSIDEFVGFTCDEVKQMLIADKVQNYKDFLLHHQETHPRSEELIDYFNNWFNLLGVIYSDWEQVDLS